MDAERENALTLTLSRRERERLNGPGVSGGVAPRPGPSLGSRFRGNDGGGRGAVAGGGGDGGMPGAMAWQDGDERCPVFRPPWVPAFAGMTEGGGGCVSREGGVWWGLGKRVVALAELRGWWWRGRGLALRIGPSLGWRFCRGGGGGRGGGVVQSDFGCFCLD